MKKHGLGVPAPLEGEGLRVEVFIGRGRTMFLFRLFVWALLQASTRFGIRHVGVSIYRPV